METQHEYLYSLFDKLDTFSNNKNQPTLKLLLDEIERYVLFHFECEEHLMRLYGFTGFAVHQTEHEQFSARLIRFLDDSDAGQLNVAALRIFATGWLMEHSTLADSEYVTWIKNKRACL